MDGRGVGFVSGSAQNLDKTAGHPCRSGAVSSLLREGVLVRDRLGGHDGMGSGVKVRAELDRVSGVALRARPHPVDDVGPAAGVLER